LTYSISYKASVAKDLRPLPPKQRRDILASIEEVLSKNPVSQSQLKGQFAGLYRLRVGDYLVVYSIRGSEVLVLRIGHRRDVYR